MYRIIYGNTSPFNDGKVICIQRTDMNMTIPIDERNSDFRAFLVWNGQQAEPLDWETPIEVEVPLPVPSTEERLVAMEDTILAMLLGG